MLVPHVRKLTAVFSGLLPQLLVAKDRDFPYAIHLDLSVMIWVIVITLGIATILLAFALQNTVQKLFKNQQKQGQANRFTSPKLQLSQLSAEQIRRIIKFKNKRTLSVLLIFFGSISQLLAQSNRGINIGNIYKQMPVLITIALILIPVILAIIILFIRIRSQLSKYDHKERKRSAAELAEILKNASNEELKELLDRRQTAPRSQLSGNQLRRELSEADLPGLVQIIDDVNPQVVPVKKKAVPRPKIDSKLSQLITWYLVTASIWLIFGTTVGEYLGLKFLAPELDSQSWLSFGRLRPVHTNAVFWGWSSLAMLGLAYYVVPRVSNTPLFNLKLGWYSLFLINACVLLGSATLMAGINNGGGEYREYIWPIMLLFGIALALTLYNFLKTIARRKMKEIYISNWYIVSAVIFTIVIALTAYLPFWQRGLGETIIQGYYMHQGVGMWFMLFLLGIVYYFLPQQLNQPIYSYNLGVLAFWTQILFYTLIGTHHFIFSAIPWWLQTVAIVGSVGMVIPVVAGTTNFLMTFKGAWYKLKDSYTLPFFLVGIIFYFTGSMQGTAEAFRSTNLFWHFTDFTVAHSHLTMYGIITFLLWGGIYALLPRLSGQEAPQITIGAHFWLALLGLLFYTVPLMYGSTLKGLHWMEGKPFIESITLMVPHWIWRAVGGTLMWLSHLFFLYNVYKMTYTGAEHDVLEEAINTIEKESI